MVSGIGEAELVQTVISLGVLLLAAKLVSELFHHFKQPAIIGMLLGGIIMGPYALGGLLFFNGESIISPNEIVVQFGEIAAIVILFIAGLEITPKEFFEKGAASFTVGSLSVIVPFFFGYIVFSFYGFEALELMLIATAITATSIAISVQVLTELGKMKTREARLILGAAIVDDI
jgi:Kef-type K+ transport system membrane component KefB